MEVGAKGPAPTLSWSSSAPAAVPVDWVQVAPALSLNDVIDVAPANSVKNVRLIAGSTTTMVSSVLTVPVGGVAWGSVIGEPLFASFQDRRETLRPAPYIA